MSDHHHHKLPRVERHGGGHAGYGYMPREKDVLIPTCECDVPVRSAPRPDATGLGKSLSEWLNEQCKRCGRKISKYSDVYPDAPLSPSDG